MSGVVLLGGRRRGPSLGGSPSLALDFMTPGALSPRISFTRASTGTYFDAGGILRTAAINAPRWDYDPSTHALRGLLIEDQAQNVVLQSSAFGNATWLKAGTPVAAPVITDNQAVAPDGTTTASSVVMPAVSGAGNYCIAWQGVTVTAAIYTFSVWLRGAVGGEQLYININNGVFFTSPRITLTAQWQRFTITSTALTAVNWSFEFGTDLRDGTQAATSAQTFYIWGAQVELGGRASSYIPTTTVAVTRSQDKCGIPSASMGWFTSPGGTWAAEFILPSINFAGGPRVIGAPAAGGGAAGPLFISGGLLLCQYDGAAVVTTANALTVNAVTKGASNWSAGSGRICLNGGAVASGAMATGYGTLATNGVNFMVMANPGVGDNASGWMRSARYWPRVLSDAEMQQVTR